MDDDFSATVIFNSPFGEITTTCKKLLEFHQEDVINKPSLAKTEPQQPTIQTKTKKRVSWDTKLVPEKLETENKKIKKTVDLQTTKVPVAVRSKKKEVEKMPAIVSHFMTVKKNRTKVYSGNTQIRIREIPTLLALCIRYVDSKKENLMGFGVLPGDLITKVLRRATVNQLLGIESKNPSLIEEKKTDDLWKIHYEKDFKIVPESISRTTWRSLYMDANNSKTNGIDQSKKKKEIKTGTSSSGTSKSISTSLCTSSKSVIILPENSGFDDAFSQALNESQSMKRKRSKDVQKKKKKRRSD